MKRKDRRRVLAIGIDSGEPTFVRRLIEAGELPVLKGLLHEGSWSRVDAHARLGSGAVWPTFFTGRQPVEHGMHSYWCWHPQSMSIKAYDGRGVTPFWKGLNERGVRIGVLDVPFAPMVGLSEGFEIVEWGPHDMYQGRVSFAPEGLAELLTKETQQHPFTLNREEEQDAFDPEGLRRLSEACFEGVRLRGEMAARLLRETETELSVVVFTEFHHAAHKLWHTAEPEHALFARPDIQRVTDIKPTLVDILREIDTQIGRLMEVAGSDASVLVFSLHGIRPSRGLPSFLQTVMSAAGAARLSGWATQSWPERLAAAFAAAKRRTPASLKKLYHRSLPQDLTSKLAQPTMMPAYDWTQTRAFALPSDQHGWIRINLAGRETKGCVPVESYRETCDEIEGVLRALVTEDGRPLVNNLMRTTNGSGSCLAHAIPDIVVHWTDAAFETPMKWNGLLLEAHPAAHGQTGQHSPEGFLIQKGRKADGAETVHATELHRIITEALGVD
jgi:predicted AlkP superfamily phosphohydrolase/phosphomutase